MFLRIGAFRYTNVTAVSLPSARGSFSMWFSWKSLRIQGDLLVNRCLKVEIKAISQIDGEDHDVSQFVRHYIGVAEGKFTSLIFILP